MTTQTVSLPPDLVEHLAQVGNKTLNDHWHKKLCGCDQWPANCPEYKDDTWRIADSLAIVLPAIITAYERQQEDSEGHDNCFGIHIGADGEHHDCDDQAL
jgi:hypothetical protein